jgi:RNA polymerase sigma factor (sigma-70 family)
LDKDELDINAVITKCKLGDRLAQEKLYRNFYSVMMQICLRYTQQEADALDVLNTGFLKVFKNIQHYDESKATLYTWIRTIIINSCLSFIQSRQKHISPKELTQDAEINIPAEVISKMASSDILALLKQLPAASKAVFNLYVIDGYNHREIADLLNISEGTSKWHLSAARKILQQLLKQQQAN